LKFNNPDYYNAIDYQIKERMKVDYADFYDVHKEFSEIKPFNEVTKRQNKANVKYWNKVSNREKYINLSCKPKDDFDIEESKISTSLLGAKEPWD
jgi:hypothetical protein